MSLRWRTLTALALVLGCPAAAQDLHYAPEEHLDKIDVALIENAASNIDLAAYVLTDWTIIEALNDAQARGVKVRIVIDNRQQSDLTRLIGIEVRRKRPGPIQHLKAYEVDGQILRTGSENFSHSAPTQDNDLIVIHDPIAVAKFEVHFEQMWSAATPVGE